MLQQRSVILIMLIYMPAQRSTMAPAAKRDRAETSLNSNPRFSPQNLMALEVLEYYSGVDVFPRF